MEFVPAVAMAALVLKFIDFLRYARAGDINGITTQVIVWLSGVGVLLLVSQTTWADGIEVGDRPLSKLGIWSVVFAGLSISSTASLLKDGLKSVDNANSSKIPTLLNPGPSVPEKSTDVG